MNYSNDQIKAIKQFKRFIGSNKKCFILDGAAGTGKTFLIKQLLEIAREEKFEVAILSTTGRGSRVIKDSMSLQGGENVDFVETVHRRIYDYASTTMADEQVVSNFVEKSPEESNTIFFVDEASMLNDEKRESELMYHENQVLTDFIHYIGKETDNKVVFIGDGYQLPPIDMEISPALSTRELKERFGFIAEYAKLNEIFRYNQGHLIYKNGNRIREQIEEDRYNSLRLCYNNSEFIKMDQQPFQDSYMRQLENNQEECILICQNNKICEAYNKEIITRRYGEYGIHEGVRIINNVNSYENPNMNNHDILSGDFGTIVRVGEEESYTVSFNNQKEPYTFRILKVTIQFGKDFYDGYIDRNWLEHFEGSEKRKQAIAVYLSTRYNIKKGKEEQEERLREIFRSDRYLSALMVNYGYAITCHKAQGGEWNHVYVDAGSETIKNKKGFRWLYTAITRGKKSVHITNLEEYDIFSGVTKEENAISSVNKQCPNTVLLDREQEKDYELLPTKLAKRLYVTIVEIFQGQRLAITAEYMSKYHSRYTFRDVNNQICIAEVWNKEDGTIKKPPTISLSTNVELKDLVEKEFKRLVGQKIIVAEEDDTKSKITFLSPEQEQIYNKIIEKLDGTGIQIRSVEHYDYQERYTFVYGDEVVTLNFIYKQNGVVSSVNTLLGKTNSEDLYKRIYQRLWRENGR